MVVFVGNKGITIGRTAAASLSLRGSHLRILRGLSLLRGLLRITEGWEHNLLLQLATVGDHDGADRLVAGVGGGALDHANDLHSLHDLSEADVLAVQVRRGHGRDEELGAIGVSSAIGHRKQSRLRVLVVEVLVLELLAVDRLAARAIAASEVAALDHEVLDDAMEGAALEVQGFAALALSLLSGAKRSTTHPPPQTVHLKFSAVFGVSYHSTPQPNAYLVQLHHNSASYTITTTPERLPGFPPMVMSKKTFVSLMFETDCGSTSWLHGARKHVSDHYPQGNRGFHNHPPKSWITRSDRPLIRA